MPIRVEVSCKAIAVKVIDRSVTQAATKTWNPATPTVGVLLAGDHPDRGEILPIEHPHEAFAVDKGRCWACPLKNQRLYVSI